MAPRAWIPKPWGTQALGMSASGKGAPYWAFLHTLLKLTHSLGGLSSSETQEGRGLQEQPCSFQQGAGQQFRPCWSLEAASAHELWKEAGLVLALTLGSRKAQWVNKGLAMTGHLLAVQPLASYSISLSLSFVICKWG